MMRMLPFVLLTQARMIFTFDLVTAVLPASGDATMAMAIPISIRSRMDAFIRSPHSSG
jgi:hypothetical protein